MIVLYIIVAFNAAFYLRNVHSNTTLIIATHGALGSTSARPTAAVGSEDARYGWCDAVCTPFMPGV